MLNERFRYYRVSKEERETIIAKIKKILEEENVLLAILFGSFVELNSFRDIDVAVYVRDSDDLDFIFKLASRLEEELGYPVDVVPLNIIPPKFRHYILTKGVIIVEKKPGLYEALLIQTMDEIDRSYPYLFLLGA